MWQHSSIKEEEEEMSRKHKNARRRERRPLKLEPQLKVKIYRWPYKPIGDIYPGRVVAVAEMEKEEQAWVG